MATATVAVTPEDALKLAVASQNGTLYLVLRPYHPKDVFTVNTDFFMLTDSSQSGTQNSNPSAPSSLSPALQNMANRLSSAVSGITGPTASSPSPVQAPAAAPKKEDVGAGIQILRGTQSTVE